MNARNVFRMLASCGFYRFASSLAELEEMLRESGEVRVWGPRCETLIAVVRRSPVRVLCRTHLMPKGCTARNCARAALVGAECTKPK